MWHGGSKPFWSYLVEAKACCLRHFQMALEACIYTTEKSPTSLLTMMATEKSVFQATGTKFWLGPNLKKSRTPGNKDRLSGRAGSVLEVWPCTTFWAPGCDPLCHWRPPSKLLLSSAAQSHSHIIISAMLAQPVVGLWVYQKGNWSLLWLICRPWLFTMQLCKQWCQPQEGEKRTSGEQQEPS